MPKKATIQTKLGVIMDLAARQEGIIMREKFSGSMIKVAIAATAASTVILPSVVRASAQDPAGSRATPAASPLLKTPWGEPDLQGIWTDDTTTPLQRPARCANQEVFTEAERSELDRVRSEVLGRERRAERGTERDVSGSYNNVFAPARARR
jgi:hypothetical protein